MTSFITQDKRTLINLDGATSAQVNEDDSVLVALGNNSVTVRGPDADALRQALGLVETATPLGALAMPLNATTDDVLSFENAPSPAIPTGSTVRVGGEYMFVSQWIDASTYKVVRGTEGTAAQSHAAGAAVYAASFAEPPAQRAKTHEPPDKTPEKTQEKPHVRR